MAHVFPNSGLSALLGTWPRSALVPGVLYVGLFASQTSGTVPDRTAFGGALPGGWTETPMFTAQRRVISAAQWGVPAVDGAGVSVTGIQVEFPTATANAGSANGWFLARQPSSVAGDDIYAFANFDDLTQLTINSGDVVRVTPKLRFHISAQA